MRMYKAIHIRTPVAYVFQVLCRMAMQQDEHLQQDQLHRYFNITARCKIS